VRAAHRHAQRERQRAAAPPTPRRACGARLGPPQKASEEPTAARLGEACGAHVVGVEVARVHRRVA